MPYTLILPGKLAKRQSSRRVAPAPPNRHSSVTAEVTRASQPNTGSHDIQQPALSVQISQQTHSTDITHSKNTNNASSSLDVADSSKNTSQPAVTKTDSSKNASQPAVTKTDSSKNASQPAVIKTDSSMNTSQPAVTKTDSSKNTSQPAVTKTDSSTSPFPSPSKTKSQTQTTESCLVDCKTVSVPRSLGNDVVEEVRRNTGLSYRKSCIAVGTVLSHIGQHVGDVSELMDRIYKTVVEVEQYSDHLIAASFLEDEKLVSITPVS